MPLRSLSSLTVIASGAIQTNAPSKAGVIAAFLEPANPAPAIVTDSRQTILFTYQEAISDRTVDPVIFLMDCRDPIGGDFARRFIPRHVIDQQIAASAGEPVPVCIALPHTRAQQLLKGSFTGLDFPPPATEGMRVVAMANKRVWIGVV